MQLLNQLSMFEQSELARHEAVIERGLKTFYEVGEALATIREEKLYRADYNTFDEYLENRWNMTRSFASRQIAAARAYKDLLPIGNILPTTESQIRPLTNLEPEQQREAWQKAVETAPDGKVTAAHVETVVREYRTPVFVEPAPPAQQTQPMALLASSKNDSWRTPAKYIGAAREVMGGIDLDPASSDEANEIIGATYYYTKEDDGLTQPWEGRVWLNPPYGKTNNQSNQGLFAAKLAQEYAAGNVTEAIMLVNLYSGYDWFDTVRTEWRCEPDHRISFIDPTTGEEGDEAKASSVFIYFGKHPEKFKAVFKQFGPCGKLSY